MKTDYFTKPLRGGYIIIAIILNLGVYFHCSGQGFYVEAPNFSGLNVVARLPDNCYVVAGSVAGDARLQKITATGQLLWNTNAGLGNAVAVDVAVSSDGSTGILATGNNNILTKTDAAGNNLWVKQLFNAQTPNGLNKIISSTNGSFYAAGKAQAPNGLLGIRLVKINTNGDIVWDKILGDATADLQCGGICMLPDGSMAIGGTVRQGSETDFLMLRVDADGNTLWKRTYPLNGRQTAYDIAFTIDGNLALLGYQQQISPTKICLLKTDATNGDLIWNRTFFLDGGLSLPGAPAVSPLSESMTQDERGQYFLTVVTNGTGKLLHLDELGKMVELVPLQPMQAVGNIIASPDGDLVVSYTTNAGTGALIKSDATGSLLPNRINGGIYGDNNNDCVFTNGEKPLSEWVVEARALNGSSRYTATDAFGRYALLVPEGEYRVIIHSPSDEIPFWEACDTPSIAFTPGTSNAVNLGFTGVKPQTNCPLMEIDIQTGTIDPCVNHIWSLKYNNSGATDAVDAVITVEKNPLTTYVSSSLPLIGQTGDILTFQAGTVSPGQTGYMDLELAVSCDAEPGSVLCVRASISPESNCLAPQPFWDGAFIEATKACTAPGHIAFTLHNKGSGNMNNELEYVIIEDQIILFTGHFRLDANEDTTINIDNTSGSAYWLRAGQSAGQYIRDLPTVFTDNCNNPVDYDSLRLQLPVNEADMFVSESCGLVQLADTASAWLTGYPFGWRPQHWIKPDQEIEYIIHFQNITGDTVDIVTIHDSLPADLLDLSTLRQGASSYPYEWRVNDTGFLFFRMAGTNVPDGESGFISFKIKPRKGLAPGTVINNTAKVRLDYAPEFVTNTTFHTLGDATVGTSQPEVTYQDIVVTPNPFRGFTNIRLKGWEEPDPVRIVVTNAVGQVVKTDQFRGGSYRLDAAGLSGGTYFFQLQSVGKTIARGRLVFFQ